LNAGLYEDRGTQWSVNRSITYPFNYENSLYNSYFNEHEENNRYRAGPTLLTHDLSYHQNYCQLDSFHESTTSSENGQISGNDETVRNYTENHSSVLSTHRNTNSDEEMQRINASIPSLRNGRNIFAEVLLRNTYSENDNNVSTDLIAGNTNDHFLQNPKTISNTSDISSNSSCSSSPADLSAMNGDPNGKSTVIRYLNEGSFSQLKYYSDNTQSGSTTTFLQNQTDVSNSANLNNEQNASSTGSPYTSVIVDAQQYQHFASNTYVQ
jgi:antitoxin component YwqK of YwqJK toxin-antitoxin module